MAAAQNIAGFLIISSAEVKPDGDHENVDVVQVENCSLSEFVVQVQINYIFFCFANFIRIFF